MASSPPFLEEHLNVAWLRPESALWDAIASTVISQFGFPSPSLDLGCGNGIFSFITAGGGFSPEYDWYRNVNPHGFWNNRDIYDSFIEPPKASWITREPRYRIDWGLDAKINLLRQAQALSFYRRFVVADANLRLPFENNSFQTVFSNILYWLDSMEAPLEEVKRVVRPGGRILLCLQDHKFKDYCVSYRWRELNSELWRLLNRGRSESSRWTISYAEIVALAQKLELKVVSHQYYISPLILKLWDIGLRPLSPVLIRMVHKVAEVDRLSIKMEWIETVRPFLIELFEMDKKSNEQGGFHFVCLEKS